MVCVCVFHRLYTSSLQVMKPSNTMIICDLSPFPKINTVDPASGSSPLIYCILLSWTHQYEFGKVMSPLIILKLIFPYLCVSLNDLLYSVIF